VRFHGRCPCNNRRCGWLANLLVSAILLSSFLFMCRMIRTTKVPLNLAIFHIVAVRNIYQMACLDIFN
jgi:hypothetical protein